MSRAASGPPSQPVAAIVLAAGRALRMGSQKLLLPLGGRPLVQWAVDAALASAASETVVVVGHEGAAVAAALDERRVRLVINTAFTGGMSTSLKVGIEAVRERCDAAVVLHADQPFVTSALIDALIERHSATGALVVRPAVGGRPATPVLLGAPLFPELLEQEGDVGGREVVARHQHEVSLVTVDDARLLADIDTIEQYEAAREML